MSEQKWTPATFEIQMGTPGDHGIALCESHRETVEGETWGPFGINAEDDAPFPPAWFVTHLPTGYQMVAAVSREAAQRFCREVADLTDWTTVQPGQLPPEIRDDVLTAWHQARGVIFVDYSEPQAVAGGALT